jgi:hypothetical protein
MIRLLRVSLRIAIAVAFITAAGSAAAQTSGADALFSQLTDALRRGDRPAVAALMDFPITVNISGLRLPVANAETFLERYADIFTPAMRGAIERADPAAVTTALVAGRLRVKALVVPLDEPRSSSDAAEPPASQTPRRINVRAGPRPTMFSGALGRGTDTYLLFVPKGQFVEIRLERVGRAAVVRVTNARTSAPLNARSAAGSVVVSGRPTSDGEYRIEVQRTAAADGEPLPYLLSVKFGT